MIPGRVQLRRVRGWRMPPNCRSVARPSKFGNPFKVERVDGVWCVEGLGRRFVEFEDRADAVEWAVFLFRCAWEMPRVYFPHLDVGELTGWSLACYCEIGTPCHVDVLLEVANPQVESVAHGGTLVVSDQTEGPTS